MLKEMEKQQLILESIFLHILMCEINYRGHD
jgi:hypothetical protein